MSLPHALLALLVTLIWGINFVVIKVGLLFVGTHLGMPAGLSSLVLQSQVFFTVLIATLLLGERPTLRALAGLRTGVRRAGDHRAAKRSVAAAGQLVGWLTFFSPPSAASSVASAVRRQVFKDRAIRTLIALAVFDQILQGVAQATEFGDLEVEFVDMAVRQRFYIGAGALAVLPEGEQFADFLQRKPQVA